MSETDLEESPIERSTDEAPKTALKRVSRRKLLIAAGAAFSLTAIGGVVGWPSLRKWLLARNIEGHFSHLSHDRDGVYRFIEFFEEQIYNMGRNPMTLLGELPKNVYLSYLASTNYFPDGEDETKELRFVSLWYPMRNVCHNPFSKRLLPDGAENEY